MYLKYRKNYFSQNGEDGIIEKLLDQLNLKQNLFVCEFGAWDGIYLSNTFNLVTKYNATALMIEGDEQKYRDLEKTSLINKNIIPIKKFVRPNGDDYRGYYHIHPELGPMVGRFHTEEAHDRLTRLTRRQRRMREATQQAIEEAQAAAAAGREEGEARAPKAE